LLKLLSSRSGPGGFFYTTRDSPGRTGCETTPAYSGTSSFSGMVRLSTVRPPGKTKVNRHELCPMWRYDYYMFVHSVSRGRDDGAPTLREWGGKISLLMPLPISYSNLFAVLYCLGMLLEFCTLEMTTPL